LAAEDWCLRSNMPLRRRFARRRSERAMDDVCLNGLRDVCTKFRAAIERCDRALFPVEFQQFPVGACGDAALILGHHLGRLDYRDLDYVQGWRRRDDDRASHAWLQMGDVSIDITADQFPEIDRKVIVERGSAWHADLEGQVEHEGDFRVYEHDAYTFHRVAALYATVLEALRAVGQTDLPHEP